jgi:hypothetical protein
VLAVIATNRKQLGKRVKQGEGTSYDPPRVSSSHQKSAGRAKPSQSSFAGVAGLGKVAIVETIPNGPDFGQLVGIKEVSAKRDKIPNIDKGHRLCFRLQHRQQLPIVTLRYGED